MDKMIPAQCLSEIQESVLYILDNKVQNRYYINKHFQNAIMNYFLEDYGSMYLRKHFQMQSNREVRRHLTSLASKSESKGTKYIVLMNIYLDSHVQLELLQEYRALFADVARLPNPFEIGTQEYISQAWKKAFGLFVLAHSFNNKLDSIFDIWNVLFVDQKIFRKRRPNAKTTLPIAETEEESTKSLAAIKNEADASINEPVEQPQLSESPLVQHQQPQQLQQVFALPPMIPQQQYIMPQQFTIPMPQQQLPPQQPNQILLAQQCQAQLMFLQQMEFQRQMFAIQQQQQQQQQMQAMLNQQFFHARPAFF